MKRKHKKYSRPKRPFDKQRIDEEAELKKNFGLKNKKEIWKAEARIKTIRGKAKALISADKEEQEAFFKKLKAEGFKADSLSNVLSLDRKDFLERRLQSVVSKKFKTTAKSARQMITHKKVLVNGKIVSMPSYLVPVSEESQISLRTKIVKEAAKNA